MRSSSGRNASSRPYAIGSPHANVGEPLKEELGLDHFEGRSWPGFHHHATLCFLAYGFLALERGRGTPTALDAVAEEERAAPFQA